MLTFYRYLKPRKAQFACYLSSESTLRLSYANGEIENFRKTEDTPWRKLLPTGGTRGVSLFNEWQLNRLYALTINVDYWLYVGWLHEEMHRVKPVTETYALSRRSTLPKAATPDPRLHHV